MVTRGKQKDSIGELEMFLEIYPDYGVAHNDLGVLYFMEGRKRRHWNIMSRRHDLSLRMPLFKRIWRFLLCRAGACGKRLWNSTSRF